MSTGSCRKAPKHTDLELPTGTGKTLPGLLIAEWVPRKVRKWPSGLGQSNHTRLVAASAAKLGLKTTMQPGLRSLIRPESNADLWSVLGR